MSRQQRTTDPGVPADTHVSRETCAPVARLRDACSRHDIHISVADAGELVALLDRIALEPQNLTAVEGICEGVDRHLADSLVALVVPAVRSARSLCDVGSGAGFPGLPLARVLSDCAVTLLESERGKAAWLSRETAASPNVRVVHDRSENLACRERGEFDVVTVRAVASTPVALELAAPLVAAGGSIVAWQSRQRVDAPADAIAGKALGFEREAVVDVSPFDGAQRCLEVWTRVGPTPDRYPRRPGVARKRPLG